MKRKITFIPCEKCGMDYTAQSKGKHMKSCQQIPSAFALAMRLDRDPYLSINAMSAAFDGVSRHFITKRLDLSGTRWANTKVRERRGKAVKDFSRKTTRAHLVHWRKAKASALR